MYFPELCGCIVGNGNRDIFHGSRFAMFPGLFIYDYELPLLNQNSKREVLLTAKWLYSLEKMRIKRKTQFLMDTDSSILYLLLELCTLQCFLLVGTFIIPWKSKFWWINTIHIPTKLCGWIDGWFEARFLFVRWTIDVGWTSTWVRIVNEWLAVGVYSK